MLARVDQRATIRGEAVERLFTRFATSTSFLAGQPTAFVLAVAFIAIWILTGPVFGWSYSWQLVVNTATTIITLVMCS